ncbi:uncharacterized mitochondrial protein AtMg00240-like [Primulina eburnea]|uniref:uncharacterized mitochondrial protein AtMg00240-like n=1 Tax=Primulina eburnea TaxID=1245227 RepID=UPI003C6C8F94
MVPTQTKYVQDLLLRSKMNNTKALPASMTSGLRLSSKDMDPFPDGMLYHSTVGALQYLTITRPDIEFSVNKVCQFMQASSYSHWKAVKHILRYLSGTLGFGIRLNPCSAFTLHGLCDDDWGSDLMIVAPCLVFVGSLGPLLFLGAPRNNLSFPGLVLKL